MMGHVDIHCADSAGSTEVTGTSDGIVSLVEECGKGTRVVSCYCTNISSSALISRPGGARSRPRRDVTSG